MTLLYLMLQNIRVISYDHDLRYINRSHNEEMLSNRFIKQM